MTSPRLHDDEMRQIIERAIELDALARAPARMDQLREIARELDISEEALERAVREHREMVTTAEREARRARGGWGSLRSAVLMPLLGGVLGAGAAALRPFGHSLHVETLAAMIAAGGVSLALILAHRDGRRPFRLQLGLGGLWGGFLAGFSVVYGSVWDDATYVLSICWGVSAVVGAAVPALRQLFGRGRTPASTPQSSV